MPKLKNIYKLCDREIRYKNIRELNLWRKGVMYDFLKPLSPDPVFIVGCSRAGTTVTYETLRISKAFKSFGYEIPQFWAGLYGPLNNNWESEAANAEQAQSGHRNAAFRYFYQQLGAGKILDKTCINVMRIPYLHALFPKASFIYIHRDGRDNISSLIEGWKFEGHFNLEQFYGKFPCDVAINGGEFDKWSFFLPPGWKSYNQEFLEEVCAFQWLSANRMALEAKKNIPPLQWHQIRYEDLFEDPETVFHTVFSKLGIEFEDSIRLRCRNLVNHPTSIVKGKPKLQKWKTQNPEKINNILHKINPLLKILGYV